jgi:hypothetical protein
VKVSAAMTEAHLPRPVEAIRAGLRRSPLVGFTVLVLSLGIGAGRIPTAGARPRVRIRYFWGTHGFDGSVILHVNGDPKRWSQICRESGLSTGSGYLLAMPYEHGPIILCNGLLQPLPVMWDRFKRQH